MTYGNERTGSSAEGQTCPRQEARCRWVGPLLYIWIGIAFLTDASWGVGLLGVGVIAIGAQLARKYFALPVEGFWLVIGIAFAACGVWELLNIKASVPGGILPMLCVVAGIIILFSAFLRKPAH